MILVTAAEKPIITISGTENVARAEFNYTRGVKIFQTVQILSQTRQEAEEIDDDVSTGSCHQTRAVCSLSKTRT